MTDQGEKITLKDVYDAINGLRAEIATNYVTKAEFAPVRAVAYGLVAVIVLAVVGAMLTQVVK